MPIINDLNQDTQKEKGYFLLTIHDLEPGKDYPVQLRWQEKDNAKGLWSTTKTLTTPPELGSNLPIPHFSSSDVDKFPGTLIITWDGKDSSLNPIKGIDHVGIFITDPTNKFGDGTKEAASFKTAGTTSIAVPAGTYTIKLASVSTRGVIGTKTSGVTITIEGAIAIEAPKLAVGLAVSSAPFAITASWGGKYASDETFTGLKSINIYASETDLGATTTAAASPDLGSNLVGTMTVNDSANKITIGMSVLKQVLRVGSPPAAPTSAQLYSLPIFFYHVTVNDNGIPYKVNNSTLYTRINSAGISPGQANNIDLASGTISIENLVAGNGQFQEWLRVGDKTTARIELSADAVNASEAGGYAVLQGLTVWDRDGVTPAFRADLSGNVAIGGYTAADFATIETTANTGKTTADSAATAAATANANAYNAQQAAGDAFAKTSRFNSDGTEIQLATKITKYGSIGSVKDSYANTNNGWWIGNTFSGTEESPVFTPQINIGSSTKYLKWDGSAVKIKGEITADSGTIGSLSNGWKIMDNSIQSYSEQSKIVFGDDTDYYSIKRTNSQFTITETAVINGTSTDNYILNTYGSAGSEGARLYIGSSGRQVEVTRSAQISGTGTSLTQAQAILSSDPSIVQAYRSGGLRNMYTVVDTEWDKLVLTQNGAYPSASGGDVLLVFS